LALGVATDLAPPPAPLDDDAWSDLRHGASSHRLDGLLVDAVASGALPTTTAQADEIAQLEIELTRDRLWQEQRLVEVVDLLESAGVPARVLKGLALAHLDYPDPQMRPTGDVDLLVRGADLDAADELLRATGARRTDPDPRPGYAAIVGKGATFASTKGEIDLHRLLVWGPLGVRLDPERLWQFDRPFTIGDRTLRTLSLPDTLLHACCHLMVLGGRRALQLRDVAQLLAHPDLDPEAALARARQWGAEAVLATAIVLTDLELARDADGELERWARGYLPTWRDRLWLRVERPMQPLSGLEVAATFIELPTGEARRALVDATLRPTPGTWPPVSSRVRAVARRVVR
jgi:hypothetical protein